MDAHTNTTGLDRLGQPMGIYVVAHIRRPNVAAAHTYYVKMHIHLIDLPKTKSPSWTELNFDLPYYRMRFLVTESWEGGGHSLSSPSCRWACVCTYGD